MTQGEHDFDFLFGRWTVHHHQLKHRLAHSDEWVDFPGTTEARPILGGRGNMDDNVLEKPAGTYRAVTVRAFNDQDGTWSIWWLDGRHPQHLDPPVIGRFKDGIGTFLADDTWEGKPIRVRFVWSKVTPRSAQWEQAFSEDAGRTWETNWIMTFERQADH